MFCIVNARFCVRSPLFYELESCFTYCDRWTFFLPKLRFSNSAIVWQPMRGFGLHFIFIFSFTAADKLGISINIVTGE